MDYRDHPSCLNSHWDLPAHEHAAYQGHTPIFKCQDGLVCATYEFSRDGMEVFNSHAWFFPLDPGVYSREAECGLAVHPV